MRFWEQRWASAALRNAARGPCEAARLCSEAEAALFSQPSSFQGLPCARPVLSPFPHAFCRRSRKLWALPGWPCSPNGLVLPWNFSVALLVGPGAV